LQKLRKRCDETGTLLIFDEVMTGFRLSKSGGAGLFEVTPDIVTYGKVLGGGFPIGAVGGKSHIMQTKNVFYGGTFSANPLSMYAAKLILEAIADQSLIQYEKLNRVGKIFRDNLNEHFTQQKKPLQIMGCGPLNRIIFTNKFIRNRKERDDFESQNQNQFYENLKEKGVFVNSNRLFHFSMCHTEDVVNEIIEKIQNTHL
jgi:glutamate-1-semialdehyde 2,1-aminomutase